MKRFLLLGAWLFAACTPPPSTVGTIEAPIVDGVRETGEPAVVLVTTFGLAGLCTGTLVAPNVVLTAKHCVQAAGASAPYQVSAFTVGVGDQLGATRNYRVRYVETTPGIYESNSSTGLTGAIVGIDVALLILRENVEGVTPIPIRRDRPNDRVGLPFTAVGFGRRPDGQAGLKFRTEGTLSGIASGVLFTQEVICSGDSGGPMIQEEPERRVIGVASFGQAGACPSSRDGYNGLYDTLDLIDRVFVLAGQCLGGEELCNSIDDDCDGEVDEGCVAFGEACTASEECAYAQLPGFLEPLESPVECVDLGDGALCTRACDPTQPEATCSGLQTFTGESVPLAGLYCRRGASACEGHCAVGSAGDAADGTACSADTECRSLLCVDPGNGAVCALPCRTGLGECPVGEVCVGSPGSCGSCFLGDIVRGARSLGEPCASDMDCSGEATCQGGACTRPCSMEAPCPDGYRCAEDLCVRGGPAELGEPCADNEDCAEGGFCATQSGRGWCSSLCMEDADCPDGMSCIEAGLSMICAPPDRILGETCTDTSSCLSGACEGSTCTRTCGAGAPCPLGFECRRDEDGSPRCSRPPPSGCSVGRGSPAPWFASLLLLGLLGARRSRNRSAGR